MRVKHLLPLVLIFIFTQLSTAQVVVGDVNINEKEDVQICQVVARGKAFSSKVTITIDYGQDIKWSSSKGSQVLRKDGKKRKFNSVVDAINFMENNGWLYMDALVVTTDTGTSRSNVYHYNFRKKK